MEYKNLNPELTPELLEKSGFKFDGYYYANEKIPVKIMKSDNEGYEVVMPDEITRKLDINLRTYGDFMNFMMRGLEGYLASNIEQVDQSKFINPSAANRYLANLVREYFSFDENLDFIIQVSPQGAGVIPNNEYTFSLINNTFCDFVVSYGIKDSEEGWVNTIELEVAPQCISWPFLINYISEIKDIDVRTIKICSVTFRQGDEEIPFFGMGIQKLSRKTEESTENKEESSDQ